MSCSTWEGIVAAALDAPLEAGDARALEAYGAHSRVGKILEIHQEDPGRIHVVIIRDVVGF